MSVVLILCGVLGLLFGSFLNVVIWRVPRGESVVRPPSHCPSCGVPIRSRDNVPVVSWLALRGRCRNCKTRVSGRYPLVELLTGTVFVLVAWRVGLHPALPAYLYLGAVGIALAFIDIDTRRLPDPLTYPSYLVGLVLLGVAALAGDGLSSYLRALEGMAALAVFYLVIVLAYPKGMGLGDVKLAGVLGLFLGWLGWGALAVGAFAGFLLGGLFGIALLLTQRAGRKSAIPFGPFMIAGALVGILAGPQLAHAYTHTLLG